MNIYKSKLSFEGKVEIKTCQTKTGDSLLVDLPWKKKKVLKEGLQGEEKYYWFKKRSSKNKNKDSIREGMTKSKIKSSFFSILPYLKYNCLKQEW